MGSLTPGATYVYESPDGGDTIYAREIGKTERKLIGYSVRAQVSMEQAAEEQLWHDIRAASKTNPALKEVLERAIIIYELAKQNG